MDLIYCAGGNPALTRIAYEEGWQLGCRSDKWHADGYPLMFIDVDYKKPKWDVHVARVQQERPRYATIPDLNDSTVDQRDIDRAIKQSEELLPHCETVLIVPKLSGQIALLPDHLAIGYSVPTSYGGAQYPIWELMGRRVHLLGGNPRDQVKCYHHISTIATVMSADGNAAQRAALSWRAVWSKRDVWRNVPRHLDISYEATWRYSCRTIKNYWKRAGAL
jgi:hypothetical protein